MQHQIVVFVPGRTLVPTRRLIRRLRGGAWYLKPQHWRRRVQEATGLPIRRLHCPGEELMLRVHSHVVHVVEQTGLLSEHGLTDGTRPHAQVRAHLRRFRMSVHVLPQGSFVDVVLAADPANMLRC